MRRAKLQALQVLRADGWFPDTLRQTRTRGHGTRLTGLRDRALTAKSRVATTPMKTWSGVSTLRISTVSEVTEEEIKR